MGSNGISFLGFNSNFDSGALVDKLISLETNNRVTPLKTKKTNLQSRNTFLGSVSSLVNNLKTSINYKNIKTGSTPISPLNVSLTGTDKANISVTTTDSAAIQNFDINVSQLATSTKRQSASPIKVDLTSASNISSANFKGGQTLANGTVTINGVTQTFSNSSGTIADIESFLSSFSGVTATYNTSTGKFDLTGISILGASGDSSNLISALGLDNGVISGSNVTGIQNLEAVTNSTTLNAIGITGSKITINGTDITIDTSASGTSVSGLISKINNSSGADVSATFDAINGKIVLANKDTGAISLTVSGDGDISNLNLSSQSLGTNAEFTISSFNNGATLVSNSNTIDDLLEGVTITLSDTTSSAVTVNIARDSSGLKTKVNNTITEINKLLSSLRQKNDAFSRSFISRIKNIVSSTIGVNGTDTFTSLIQAGLKSTLDGEGKFTGYSMDSTIFENAFVQAPDELVKTFFGNSSDPDSIYSSLSNGDKGIFVQLNEALEDYVDSNSSTSGIITQIQDSINSQIKSLNTQITRTEDSIEAYEKRLTAQFAALDRINAQYQNQRSAVTNLSTQLNNNKG